MLKKASSKLLAALFAIIALCIFSISASALNVGTVNCGVLNLRADNSTEAEVLDRLYEGTKVVIISTEGDWHKVNHNSNTGYLHGDYITVTNIPENASNDNANAGGNAGTNANTNANAGGSKGIIVGSVVNLRAEPSTSSEVLAQLNKYTQVDIKGAQSEWYSVSVNGQSGYIYSDYLELSNGSNVAAASGANVVSNVAVSNGGAVSTTIKKSSRGSEIVAIAKRYLGTPYVYGGTTPSGFDCSGFTSYVYKKYGYPINRTASAQMSNGSKVSKANLQPGDLVFFKSPSRPSAAAGHVGIYVGNGNFIHSPNSNSYVKISPLSSSYYAKNYCGARRVVS